MNLCRLAVVLACLALSAGCRVPRPSKERFRFAKNQQQTQANTVNGIHAESKNRLSVFQLASASTSLQSSNSNNGVRNSKPTELFAARPPAIEEVQAIPQPSTIDAEIDLELSSRELSLLAAIRIALDNSELIRVREGFLTAGNRVYAQEELVTSRLDPAITSTEFLVGRRGVQAALADFDTQLSTRLLWGGDDRIQNNRLLSGGVPPGETLDEQTAIFEFELAKNLRRGGRIALVHDWNYNRSNRLGLLFPSAYDGSLRAQFRQPLLAGAGREYTSIIGNTDVSLDLTGTPQGFLIAQVNQNVSRLDLVQAISKLVHDVASQYWALSLAQNNLNLLINNQGVLVELAEKIEARSSANAPGGETQVLAQVRDLQLQAEVEIVNARSTVEKEELLLRRLMGVPSSDLSRFVASDPPVAGELIFDIEECVGIALASRIELRKQQQVLRGQRLEQRAAQLLLKPRLDLVTEYRLNGFGDKLFGDENPFSSSYTTLLSGDQTGWNAGFEYTRPVRNRLAKQRLRNANLKLRKAQIQFRQQQQEIQSEIRFVASEIDRAFQEKELQERRVNLTRSRLEAQQSTLEVSDTAQDLISLANTHRAFLDASISFQASVVACAQALEDLEYRKGRTFAEFGISLR